MNIDEHVDCCIVSFYPQQKNTIVHEEEPSDMIDPKKEENLRSVGGDDNNIIEKRIEAFKRMISRRGKQIKRIIQQRHVSLVSDDPEYGSGEKIMIEDESLSIKDLKEKEKYNIWKRKG